MTTTITEQLVVNISEDNVLRDVGYDAESEPPARITNLVHEYADHVNQLINPLYSWVIRDIDFVIGRSIFVEDGVMFSSGVISELLKKCEKVAVFALTIDSYLEEAVNQLTADGSMVQARVLDAIGSNAAEQVAQHVQYTVTNRVAARGLRTSRRFSPGYCDWKIDQQEMLFRALNGSMPYIRLTDEYLMLPRKSVSGIIGIGTRESGVENYNPCRNCRRENCPGRR